MPKKYIDVVRRIALGPDREFADIVIKRMHILFNIFKESMSMNEYESRNGFFEIQDYSYVWRAEGSVILHNLLVFLKSTMAQLKKLYAKEKRSNAVI